MKVFGAGYNLALFENHILVTLEEARLDYAKAFPDVEVFLGEVFRKDSFLAKPGEIFLPDADEYRSKHGAEAGVVLAQTFWVKLGEMVTEKYLPANSPQWVELEKQLGIELDHNTYHLPGKESLYCPAIDTAASLFIAALLGETKLEFVRIQETESSSLTATGGEYLAAKSLEKISMKINYHSWRCWFYSLWDQYYEWGRITINERTAEANGKLYKFTLSPRWEGESAVIQPRQLLEEHGFKVVIHSSQTLEYWR